jgi:hypothetical protein
MNDVGMDMLYPARSHGAMRPRGDGPLAGNDEPMPPTTLRNTLIASAIAALSGCPATPGPAPTPTPVANRSPIASPSPSASPTAAPTPRPSASWDPNVQRRLSFQSAKSTAVVGPFRLVAGDRLFRCVYEGKGAMSVYLIRHDASDEAQLFNKGGPFSDSAHHTVTTSADYDFQITGADGHWRLDVE